MKRPLSLALALILTCTLGAPATAAVQSDARLSAVTQQVKQTLGIDTQVYDQFYGNLVENELSPVWHLSWSGESGSLEVTASEEGKVISFYRYDNEERYSNPPLSLPEGDPAQAQAAATAFLEKVMAAGESAPLDSSANRNALGMTQYQFRGTVRLNGLPSPLTFSVSVRGADNAITRFYRDDMAGTYLDGVPSAQFRTGQAAAKALLRDTLSLRLEYVLADDGKTAVLRYLPNSIDEYYVDDVTGELVNLTEQYRQVAQGASGGATASAAPEAGSSASDQAAGLTPAELEGVEKLSGVLDKAALDQKARAISELGLERYTLASVAYNVERSDLQDIPAAEAKVTAWLVYGRQSEGNIWQRYVGLDAKTGVLEQVSSSMPWLEEYKATVDQTKAQTKAETFLGKYQPEAFAQSALYTQSSSYLWQVRNEVVSQEWSFTFAQQANGFFFPTNQLNLGIDSSDGSVSYYRPNFDTPVTFESAQGILSLDQATDAYLDTFLIQGGYVSVPQALDLSDSRWQPLVELGYTYLYSMKLGYQPVSTVDDGWLQGIDAKTGAPVIYHYQNGTTLISYDDLDSIPWAKASIEGLAQYGIGYDGGSFAPGKALTQLDFIVLLSSTQGNLVDPATLDQAAIDALYRNAYSMGILARADRDEYKQLTRIEVLKLLLDAGGYGPVAGLQGIYQTAFSDQGEIPADVLGYAALAQGLGVAKGDGAGCLRPTRTATRAEGAAMLYTFMKRAAF